MLSGASHRSDLAAAATPAADHPLMQRLMEEQRDLMHAVSRTEHDGRGADEDAVADICDKATNSYTKELMFHISNTGRKRLQLINDALERLQRGTFGRCAVCEEEIDGKRLAAAPWARNCVHCQEKAEMGLLAN